MKPVVRVLGRNANHVGDLFELLMKELLARQGFASFVRNAYKTGAEIDLRAAHRVTAQPLLCECKARGRRLDTNAIKVFFAEWTKEHATDQRLYAFVISLSGYSGTARQWYLELDAGTRQQFALLDSDDLLRQLEDSGAILSAAGVVELLCQRYSLEHVEDQWLSYSDSGLTWMLKYRTSSGEHLFTIVGPKGETLPTWRTAAVAKLLRRHVRGADFFGLDVRRKVQIHLFRNTAFSRDDLAAAIGESSPDVVAALAHLAQEGRIVRSAEYYSLSHDVVHFVNAAREFLETDDAVAFASSAYAQHIIGLPALIRYIDGRYHLEMEASEREALVGLMRMSPSALRYALFTDSARSLRTFAHIQEIITNPEEKAQWLTLHRLSLLQETLFRAIHDLTSEGTNLSEHLGSLGVKRFRIAARLVVIGNHWKSLRVHSEHNIAIAQAGGDIKAGSLISYTDPAEFHLWDGLLNLEAEEFGRAERDFKEALAAAKKAGDLAKTHAALNNLSLVFMRQKRWQTASEVLAEVLDAEPETYTPYTNMVICLGELGLRDEAAAVVRKAVERFPDAEKSAVIVQFRSGGRPPTV